MALTYLVRTRAREGQEAAVAQLLLSNVERVREEHGNVAFAVHRSRVDPREFWLYETWVDLEAVEVHESGTAFAEYKERLRPLVEPDSVLFGDTEPLAAIGYQLPEAGETLPERFVRALGMGDRRSSTRSTTQTSSCTRRSRGRSVAARPQAVRRRVPRRLPRPSRDPPRPLLLA